MVSRSVAAATLSWTSRSAPGCHSSRLIPTRSSFPLASWSTARMAANHWATASRCRCVDAAPSISMRAYSCQPA
eukprot:350000-Chlamydomonas_euryale.AAC.4